MCTCCTCWWWLGEEMYGIWSRGSQTRGRPKRIWREVEEKGCQARKLSKEDAMDCCRWRKLIKDVWWSGWVWVGECFFWYRPTWAPRQKAVKRLCVSVTVYVRVVRLQSPMLDQFSISLHHDCQPHSLTNSLLQLPVVDDSPRPRGSVVLSLRECLSRVVGFIYRSNRPFGEQHNYW